MGKRSQNETVLPKKLSRLAYQVTQEAMTELAFSGQYNDFWEEGEYRCVCCGASLFSSGDKFDAHCGWPSYSKPVAPTVLAEHLDYSHNMFRIEVCCCQCNAHLGHVFEDGPVPTKLRYCINSAALEFCPR